MELSQMLWWRQANRTSQTSQTSPTCPKARMNKGSRNRLDTFKRRSHLFTLSPLKAKHLVSTC